MFAVGVLSYRSVAKRFFFKYKELIFNDESFVLFASTSSIFGYVKPSFHVIYNGVEYSRSSRIIWTGVGALTPDDIIIPYLKDLIDWFSDQEFSKFLKIDIDTEKSGKIQCVYKLFAKDFIVTDQLDNLKGCFKYSQSTIKSKKAINDDDEDLDGNDIDIYENIDIDEDEN